MFPKGQVDGEKNLRRCNLIIFCAVLSIMQILRFWVVAIGLVVLAASCHHRGNRMIINSGDDNMDLRYEGEVRFNDSETTIEEISEGGFLNFRHNWDRLLAGPDGKGGVGIELYAHGEKIDAGTAEGRKLMGRMIRDLIELGFDAQGRMDRLYRKGGYPALLAETDSMRGDYVKGLYFGRLLGMDTIPPGDMANIVKKSGFSLSSDHEKERLLTLVGTTYLKNDSIVGFYLDDVAGINSDYEKSLTLTYFLQYPLPV
jgi:hypothetical protein